MKRIVVLATIILWAAGCSHIPRPIPVADSIAEEMFNSCNRVFIIQNTQLVHRITAYLPNGGTETFLGISQIYPAAKKNRCVLMTLEGLVLLEAEDSNKISVKRAIAPFDHPGFAAGMLADIRLLFLPPESTAKEAAVEDNGNKICRYFLLDGNVQEIVLEPRGKTSIRLYDHGKKLCRTVGFAADKDPLNAAKQAELKAYGLTGYRLEMALIEAQLITP